MGLVCGTSRYVKIFHVAWHKVVKRTQSSPYRPSTHCDTLPIINNTDFVEFALENKYIYMFHC